MENREKLPRSTGGFVHLLRAAATKQPDTVAHAQSMDYIRYLGADEIRSLSTKWDWKKLSASDEIKWSVELIRQFQEKWHWNILSSNSSLPWQYKDLLWEFKTQWDWNALSSNQGLPWSVEEFEQLRADFKPEEKRYMEYGEPRLQWFSFPCNVIPFRYDPTQGGWLYVHVMQLMDDNRLDALRAVAQDSDMGTLSLAYPYTAAHEIDQLEKWVRVYAPLQRYLDLTCYGRELTQTYPAEQRELQAAYRIFVQTLGFEGLPYRDKRYLMAKHRQFQRRLANRYYADLH